jgi:hypothetical protein
VDDALAFGKERYKERMADCEARQVGRYFCRIRFFHHGTLTTTQQQYCSVLRP